MEGNNNDLLLGLIVYYLVLMIPTLYLHFEYYRRNKNQRLLIDTSLKSLTINEQDSIPFSEIECIYYVMPPVWHRNSNLRMVPFEDYHYAKIKLKNGQEFIFTCLMHFNVQEALGQIVGVPVVKKKPIIASTYIGLNRLQSFK
jgi:hypothetical protein